MTLSDIEEKELNRLKYGWSKYGGSNNGLIKDRIDDEWCCQCCGSKQPKGAPTYLIEFALREYLRICAICEHTRIEKKLTDFYQLKRALT